jgi:glucose/arabinose dehydrogenase
MTGPLRPAVWSGLLFLTAVVLSACSDRPLRTDDIDLPDGFAVDVAVRGLDAPTMATFDEQGRMVIAESAYGGAGEAKVTRVEPDGSHTTLADGNDFGLDLPVTAVAVHDAAVYVVHAGMVSMIQDGRLTPVLSHLPGQGDHQANQLVFQDGWMYLAIGTVTNSAVVGTDNAVFGWLNDPAKRDLHDVPCEDVRLTDEVVTSTNPLDDSGELVTTSAYAPYGDDTTAGATVPGDVRCNGAILRARPDGSELEVYAWGLRNPYGLREGPDGAIYVTMHGFDARGERPVENAWDCFYRVQQGAWYGFPDFACDTPVTDPRFKPIDKPQPQFLLEEHPTETPPAPIARFDPHAATNGFDFAPSDAWGPPGDAFIALFGDFTPATGTVPRPVGTAVVRVNAESGEITPFMANKNSGRASTHSGGGLEHPSDVTFGPDGAMYVTDWGVAHPTEDGLRLEPNSGVVWRVSLEEAAAGLDIGVSRLYAVLLTLALAVGTFLLLRGPRRRSPIALGLLWGAVAGLVMGAAAMLVSELALNLPWYAPERVFATMVMGQAGVANILEFAWLPFIVGLIVVIALTVLLGALFAFLLRARRPWQILLGGLLYALTVWALLQYFVLAELFPLIAERGFPPFWYGFSFAVYGLVLGGLFAVSEAQARRHESR